MKTCIKLAATAAILALCASPVSANPGMKDACSASFAKMDTDKNGYVTKEEFMKAHPDMLEAAFQAIDTSRDGTLSLEEWESFMTGHAMSMCGGKPSGACEAPMVMPPKN